ncbi:wd repeat-containing protein [Anaeramoeba ignava]|uniref:Wd repeat-containing protein n=1 Tax=Anaeramoeba ignava TaxID=1746090 RepID=A0A9Q0R9Y3_ANAIG|nr:wd repeat-containing protein [Anaeramoeba ignava]
MNKDFHKIIPGILDNQNTHAIDWGKNALLSYGCQNIVVVLDPESLSVLQALDGHKAFVTAVCWSQECFPKENDKTFYLKLASGDSAGNIIIWEPKRAKALFILSNETLRNKSVIQINWILDNHNQSILSFHSPSKIVLWNLPNKISKTSDPQAGSIKWELDLPFTLTSIAINPFNDKKFALCSSTDWLYLLKDFNSNKKPIKIAKKYQLITTTPKKETDQKKGKEESRNVKQLIYSNEKKDILYFIFEREIMVVDCTFDLVIGSARITDSDQPLCKMKFSNLHPNIFYCLHEDGSISQWEHHFDSDSVHFKKINMANQTRLSKGLRNRNSSNIGFCKSPYSNDAFIVITIDGRIWKWKADSKIDPILITQRKTLNTIKLIGHTETISSQVTSLSSCTFSKESNLIAVGTIDGILQILDYKKGAVQSSYYVFQNPIIGLNWINSNIVVAFTYSEISPNSYFNQIIMIDIISGRQKLIKEEIIEKDYITAIHVAYSSNLITIMFNQKPFEIWSLETFCPLQTISPNNVVDFKWIFDDSQEKQRFIFVVKGEGIIYRYYVEGLKISKEAHINFGNGIGQITNIAYKSNTFVIGTNSGIIHYININVKKTISIQTGQKRTKKMEFFPFDSQILLYILFENDEFAIFDLVKNRRVGGVHKKKPDQGVFIAWTPRKNGTVFIYDLTMKKVETRIHYRRLDEKPQTPFLFTLRQASRLKLWMKFGMRKNLNKKLNENQENEKNDNIYENKEFFSIIQDDPDLIQKEILEEIDGIPDVIYQTIKKSGTAKRCLVTANYFADNYEEEFWSLALFYLDYFASHKDLLPKKEDDLNNQIEKKEDDLNIQIEKKEDNLNNQIDKKEDDLNNQIEKKEDDLKNQIDNKEDDLNNQIDKKDDLKNQIDNKEDNLNNQIDKKEDDLKNQIDKKEDNLKNQIDNKEDNLNIQIENIQTETIQIESIEIENIEIEKNQNELKQNEKIIELFSQHVQPLNPNKIKLTGKFADLRSREDIIESSEEIRIIKDVHRKDSYSLTQNVMNDNLFLNHKKEAIDLLFETPKDHQNYFQDLLKAAIISATVSQEHFSETICKIADSLMAEKRNSEAIQIYMMVGDYEHACQALQKVGMWGKAYLFSKMHLPQEMHFKFTLKYGEHLVKVNRILEAIHVFITIGEFKKVFELLLQMKMFDTAFFFLMACHEFGLSHLKQIDEEQKQNQKNQRLNIDEMLQKISLSNEESKIEDGNIILAPHQVWELFPFLEFCSLDSVIYDSFMNHLKDLKFVSFQNDFAFLTGLEIIEDEKEDKDKKDKDKKDKDEKDKDEKEEKKKK